MHLHHNKNILVVGGAGYIGSHMVRALLKANYRPILFDNLSTGHREFIPRGADFIKGDLRNPADIEKVFRKYKIDAVMHFAAYAVVPESVSDPIKYYENNVSACVNLLAAMLKHNAKHFIFSSTCAIFGQPKRLPISEMEEKKPESPYGRTKLMVENILEDVASAHDFSYISLRYFNAAGAGANAEIGEWRDSETHLIPNILKVAKGKKKELLIFGDDYPTPDGTCIRDYIHVEDLCRAHLLALEALKKGTKRNAFNLGTGRGHSVKEVVAMVEKVTGKKVKTKIVKRRAGDPAQLVASYEKAKKLLGWKPAFGLEQIVSSAWQWELVLSKIKNKRQKIK